MTEALLALAKRAQVATTVNCAALVGPLSELWAIVTPVAAAGQRYVDRGMLPDVQRRARHLNLKDYEDCKEHHSLRIVGAG